MVKTKKRKKKMFKENYKIQKKYIKNLYIDVKFIAK